MNDRYEIVTDDDTDARVTVSHVNPQTGQREVKIADQFLLYIPVDEHNALAYSNALNTLEMCKAIDGVLLNAVEVIRGGDNPNDIALLGKVLLSTLMRIDDVLYETMSPEEQHKLKLRLKKMLDTEH